MQSQKDEKVWTETKQFIKKKYDHGQKQIGNKINEKERKNQKMRWNYYKNQGKLEIVKVGG